MSLIFTIADSFSSDFPQTSQDFLQIKAPPEEPQRIYDIYIYNRSQMGEDFGVIVKIYLNYVGKILQLYIN